MRMRIESADNKKIKLAAGLAQRRQREKTGLFRAEGVRLGEMAAASGWEILYCLCTAEAADEARGAALLAQAGQRGVPVYEVPRRLYEKVSGTESPQGILLVMKKKAARLQELAAKDSPLYVVLDGVQDPGNAGTLLRTADAIGADGVLALEGTVDLFSDKAVRASMGSLFHLPVCLNVRREELKAFCTERQVRLLATALDEAALPHFAADFCPATAVAFGNEGSGVSPELLGMAESIYIPMFGQAESLNVAAASAAVLYEAVRQRRGFARVPAGR